MEQARFALYGVGCVEICLLTNVNIDMSCALFAHASDGCDHTEHDLR